MNSVRPVVASSTFFDASSPPAVGRAMAVVMMFVVLALACGTSPGSKAAESDTGSGILTGTNVEDPALEWAKMAAGTIPQRSTGAVMPVAGPRPSLSSTDRTFILPRSSPGPSQEWMGMSKLVIPLLVTDLVTDQAFQAARAMTIRAAGSGGRR